MIRKRSFFTLVVVVILISFFIPKNLAKLVSAHNDESNSTIAGIQVSNLKEKEIRTLLQKEIEAWTQEPIVISGAGKALTIDSSQISFDIESTITQFKSMTDHPWYAFWLSERKVQLPLQLSISEDLKESINSVRNWDGEATIQLLLTQSAYLKEHQLEAVVKDDFSLENELLALSIQEIPTNQKEVETIIAALNEQVLHVGEVFSFIQTMPSKMESSNKEAFNFTASVLYDAVLKTELTIVERHAQTQLPDYLRAGINAEIDLVANKDLQFVNDTQSDLFMKASITGNSLKIAFYSNEKGKEVVIQSEQHEIAPRVIYRYSSDLPIGKEQLIQEGKKGQRVTIYRTISNSGSAIEEHISRDYYPPTNRILLVSSKVVAEEPNPSTVVDALLEAVTGLDLDGNRLSDVENTDISETTEIIEGLEDEHLPEGSYYDKGGNLIIPEEGEQ